MDGTRFDEMTRRLSALATRRRALGVVAGLLGGAVVAGEAAAGPASVRRQVCRPAGIGCTRNAQCCSEICETGRSLPRNRRNRCACPEGLVGCGSQCVDTQTDVANCGACGEACDSSGEVCVSGVCEPTLDCTTYDGSFSPGASFCFSTVEGGAALSLSCSRGSDTPCASSVDCADEVISAGEMAVCTTGFAVCLGLDSCKQFSQLPSAMCVVTQTESCPTT